MKQFSSNRQEVMAENFMLNDVIICQHSYEAMVKIQRWKYIMQIPGVTQRIKKEAVDSIQRSLLNYVSNTFVLLEEGYYYSNPEN